MHLFAAFRDAAASIQKQGLSVFNKGNLFTVFQGPKLVSA